MFMRIYPCCQNDVLLCILALKKCAPWVVLNLISSCVSNKHKFHCIPLTFLSLHVYLPWFNRFIWITYTQDERPHKCGRQKLILYKINRNVFDQNPQVLYFLPKETNFCRGERAKLNQQNALEGVIIAILHLVSTLEAHFHTKAIL